MHHCTEGTENLNFFELKLLCPWLHNYWVQIVGWFHLGCESAHTGRAICTDQWQVWSPPPLFTNEWCGREWRQKLSLLIISLLGWFPLGMPVFLLPCRAPWRWTRQLARKMQVGKEVAHPAWSHSVPSQPFPVLGGGREMLFLWYWWESLGEALFPPHLWTSVSTFLALVITTKSCHKSEMCINFVDSLAQGFN